MACGKSFSDLVSALKQAATGNWQLHYYLQTLFEKIFPLALFRRRKRNVNLNLHSMVLLFCFPNPLDILRN